VYKRQINPDASEQQMVKAGKMAALVALVISALLTPLVAHLGGIFTFFQTGVTYLASPFIAVFLMGILWKRTNYPAALFGMVGGLIMQVIIAFGAPAIGLDVHWLYLAFLGQALTMIAVWAVSLMTAPPDPADGGVLVWKAALLSQYDEKVRRPWYQHLKLWFAIWALAWCFLYYWFW
jgi:solute:Na+ symporter, SSS family